MLFNFRLCPFNQIPPWGKLGDRSLHWYGLSYGYYWLDAGGVELLRYSPAIVDLTALRYPNSIWTMGMSYGIPYVDYYVAHFWDNAIEILPYVVEPIPPWLARTLGPDSAWTVWQQNAEAALRKEIGASLTQREAIGLLHKAQSWWGKRHLDTLYLQAGADITFWSDGADIHVEWDNRGRMLEDVLAWDAQLGEYRLPVAAFMEEVRSFDARFIRRMHDRVALAQVDWTRPEVTLDPYINATQAANAPSLNKRMTPGFGREPDDWDAVYQAIARIERLMPASVPQLL